MVSSLLEEKANHPPSELSQDMRVIYGIKSGHVAHDVADAIHVKCELFAIKEQTCTRRDVVAFIRNVK